MANLVHLEISNMLDGQLRLVKGTVAADPQEEV